jgi:hypothetical protein
MLVLMLMLVLVVGEVVGVCVVVEFMKL